MLYCIVLLGIICIFFLSFRLLKNHVVCDTCSCPMALSNKKRKLFVDGYLWFCEEDATEVSVRKGSVFEATSRSLKELLTVAYYWTLPLTPGQIAKEARVRQDEVANMCRLFRSICELWLKNNTNKVGGLDAETGCPVVVQLQIEQVIRPREAKSCQKTCWILSGEDKKTGEYFIVEVSNDQPRTVEKAILDNVQLGTKLVTRGSWPATNLCALGYIHTATDGTETESDHHDSLWSKVKHSFGLHSGEGGETAVDSYLHQWVFQNRAKARGQGIFESLIMAIQVSNRLTCIDKHNEAY